MRRFGVFPAKVREKVLLDSFRLQPKQIQPDYVSSYAVFFQYFNIVSSGVPCFSRAAVHSGYLLDPESPLVYNQVLAIIM